MGGVGSGSSINLKKNSDIYTDSTAGEPLNASSLTVEGSGGNVAQCDSGTCTSAITGQTLTYAVNLATSGSSLDVSGNTTISTSGQYDKITVKKNSNLTISGNVTLRLKSDFTSEDQGNGSIVINGNVTIHAKNFVLNKNLPLTITENSKLILYLTDEFVLNSNSVVDTTTSYGDFIVFADKVTNADQGNGFYEGVYYAKTEFKAGKNSNFTGTVASNKITVEENAEITYMGDSVLASTTIPGCTNGSTFHHIRIEHDGQGSTCASEQVTIKACENSDCSSLVSSSVTVTLSPTGWVGGDTFSFTGGSTTRSLSRSASGAVTLAGSSIVPVPTLTSALCYVGANQSCQLTFTTDAVFSFDVPDHWANEPQSVTVSALKQDLSGACVPAFTSTRNVRFWSTYLSPLSGTKAVSVNGSTIGSASPGSSLPVAFNSSGQASLTVVYADAGQMRLNAQDASDTAVAGNDSFVAYPKFCVESTTANALCESPYNTCSVFVGAGNDFNLNIRAVGWESSGDADYCIGNVSTPNYAQTDVQLNLTLVSPSPARASGALGITSVNLTGGSITLSNQTYSEVGAITVSAIPSSSYLGVAAASLAGTSSLIGRFTPSYFQTEVENACPIVSPLFAYSAQPFDVKVTAYAKGGGKTTNYDSSVDTSPNFAKVVTLMNSDTAVNLTGNTLSSFSAGTGTATGVKYSFASTPASPLSLVLRAIDTDSISSIGHTEALLSIRQGRLRLSNAYGSVSPVKMPVEVQYWSGKSWVKNIEDSCTNTVGGAPQVVFSATPANGWTLTPNALAGGEMSQGGLKIETGTPGTTTITASVPDWLKPEPSAKATVGVYGTKESRKAIHIRELY